MRGPTQSARAHAKCAGPRKVRGHTQSARAALWMRGTPMRGRARNAWAAVQLRGPHWVRGPQLRVEVSGPHCPRTSPALAIRCPRNATAVPLAWAAMSRNRPARKGLTFEMSTVRGQQHSSSTRTDVLVKVTKFWDRKSLDLRGTRTPNLRIHAEWSNYLSYQGQTCAAPCFLILALVV